MISYLISSVIQFYKPELCIMVEPLIVILLPCGITKANLNI